MILSNRVPHDYGQNRLALLLEEKRRAGRHVLDLTVTNPTRVGLPRLDGKRLARLADPRAGRYEPEPRGALDAREAVAAYYASRCERAAALDADRVVLLASTSEAYARLFQLLCQPDDEIVVPRPSYPLFEPLARLSETRIREYRLAYDEGWRVDIASLEAAIGPKTRAIVVVEPNNPTGSCLSSPELEAVETICEERRAALISDEVFGDFPWPPRHTVMRGLLGERRVPTFILNGISKLAGLPQLKLAWIAVAGPEAAARVALNGLEWIADLFLSVATPVQIALSEILEGRGGFQTAVQERISANLSLLRRLARESGQFSPLEADGGWSAVLRFDPAPHPDCPETLAEWALKHHDVLVHPGHFYELPLEEDIVASLLTEPAVLAEGLGRIAGFPLP